MELIDRAQDTIAKHQHEQTTAVPVKENVGFIEAQSEKEKKKETDKETDSQVPPAAEAAQQPQPQQPPQQQTTDLNSEFFEDASIPESSSFVKISGESTVDTTTTTTTTAQSDSEANNNSFEHELGGYEDEGTDDGELED
ncbi:UNVERIFIED_CONTAM: hypothetical protein HDU68_002802, partial [Siphonaria sp. JEL0065]